MTNTRQLGLFRFRFRCGSQAIRIADARPVGGQGYLITEINAGRDRADAELQTLMDNFPNVGGAMFTMYASVSGGTDHWVFEGAIRVLHVALSSNR